MTFKKSLPILLLAALFLALIAFFAVPTNALYASAHDIAASEFDPSEFSELTYGIYWYNEDSDVPVAAKDATNFDPTKPTLIYTHGMKYMGEGITKREGLSLKDNNKENLNQKGFSDYEYEEEFYLPLLEEGYNVGVFFWNQLADVLMTEECRFWVTTSKIGMSYSYLDENGNPKKTNVNDSSNPTKTVTALYRDCIIAALGKNFSGHLQLAGHSMGGQLTLAVTQALCVSFDNGEIGSNLLPDRITLLDPYLGSRKCTGIVDTTGEEVIEKPAATLAAEAAENIAKHDIPIEAYGANEFMVYRYFAMDGIGIEDPDEIENDIKLFSDNIAWVYLKAMMQTYIGFIPTHTMAVDYYFTTMYMHPAYDNADVEIPSFKASDDQIRRLRGMAFRQDYDPDVTNPNPIYQKDCIYIRVDAATGEDIRYPEELPAALAGKVSDPEKTLTVKLYLDNEVVAETATLKGRYFFTNVEDNDYKIVVFDGEKEVGSLDSVSILSYYEVTTAPEEIKVKISKKGGPIDFDVNKTIALVIIGVFVFVILLLLLFYKRSRG